MRNHIARKREIPPVRLGLTLMLSVFLNVWATASSAAELVVSTYSGRYSETLQSEVFQHFQRDTGVRVTTIDSSDSSTLGNLVAQVSSGMPVPDIVTVNAVQARKACDEGLIDPIDATALVSMQDSNRDTSDFYHGALGECAVAVAAYAMPLVYDSTRFSSDPPDSVTDLFNWEKYPGKRGLNRNPKYTLPWALLAAGVSRDAIELATVTDNDLDAAFAKLDGIKDDIEWWDSGRQAAMLLANGVVTMTPIWSPSVAALRGQVRDLDMVWTQRVAEFDYFAIPASTQRKDEALKLLAFITDVEAQVRLGRQGWGTVRSSATANLSAIYYQCPVGECPCDGTGGCSKACCKSQSPSLPGLNLSGDKGDAIRERFDRWLVQN